MLNTFFALQKLVEHYTSVKVLISVDISMNSGSGGLLGAISDLAATAIATITTDKVVAIHRLYGQDQKLSADQSYVKAIAK